MHRVTSKHSSDHYVLFRHGSAVTPRYRCVIMHEVADESLRKICRYQKNVPQHYYLLDTLVISPKLVVTYCYDESVICMSYGNLTLFQI